MGNSVGSDGDDEYDAAGATGVLLVGCASSRDGDGHEEHGGDDSAAISVSVEPPLLWHTDWAAWKIYLAEYCERTKQVLPVKETLSRAERIKRLKCTKKGKEVSMKENDDSLLLPEAFDPYQRTYIRTHGWKKRKSRSEGETGVMSLASAHMRRVYGRFSEVLLVDCSHKTNRYNYQLLTFMAMNEFGEGAVVLEANGDWHMEKAIAHFKRAHPTRINLISADDASQVDAAIHKMVYAASEEDYKATHKTLKGLCERIGLTGFFEYFEKNWDSCQDRWFKDGVDSSLSMSMCVKALVASDRRMQNEYQYRLSRVGQFVNSNYDEEMSNVLRITTHYVAKQIEQQWTNSDRKLEKVRQFSYEKFKDANSGRREQRVKTHAERYREAVRATHLIATEMADIDDESEFEEMLQFVLNQWRNVRQREIADFEQFKENGDGFIDTVQIKDVGNFSRMQIETFKKVQDLKESVQLGVDMHKWLIGKGLPSLPAKYHALANKVAADVLSAYTRKQVDGLPNLPDFEYAMLYRATPPIFAGFQSAIPSKTRTRRSDADLIDVSIHERVLQQVHAFGVDVVLLPLNFPKAHWCCVIIKVTEKCILYYDPLNQVSFMNTAKAVAPQLKIRGLQDYTVVGGRQLDMSNTSLTRRRFELFYYLPSGQLLPLQDLTIPDRMEHDDT
ncbi:hypothetical protein PHYSODRAFT_332361 [Phytophthora sojae]|uniref:Uncharacterized protein n=1 Tax=Phytophthora sojae (strain P6497) TaxID=1094619 RepID=G4ZGY7_PHYSP|nr:hypothetical protein PHYSODRAFT_332361 [Phytophthora sojae]EGZ18612.1 hypothetical protein PHYSODRAFT_332361 [Phytophthora sojae]|eukprot:XP_009527670.1 hypothetical protein PHYSODRAFT_332361 [Phytophthora sojae]